MTIILRVRTTLTYGTGGPGLHTAYWRPGTGGGVTADATDCVARVRAFWVASASVFTNQFAAFPQSDVAQIDDVTGALTGLLSATPVTAVAGTAPVGMGPLAGMALLRLRTAQVINDRLLRGRWFLGPISSQSINVAGGVNSTQRNALDVAGTAMLTGGATASFPVVWHRPGPAGVGTSSAITSVSCWEQVASLRSRRDG